MKSKVQASANKQMEFVANEWEGKRRFKQIQNKDLYYRQNPWLWRPSKEEKKKLRAVEVICKNCNAVVAELDVLDKSDWRTKWYDWKVITMMKDSKWYGCYDFNINKPVDKGGRDYIPVGYITVSCCCGNSERDKLKMQTGDKKDQKGFKVLYKK